MLAWLRRLLERRGKAPLSSPAWWSELSTIGRDGRTYVNVKSLALDPEDFRHRARTLLSSLSGNSEQEKETMAVVEKFLAMELALEYLKFDYTELKVEREGRAAK